MATVLFLILLLAAVSACILLWRSRAVGHCGKWWTGGAICLFFIGIYAGVVRCYGDEAPLDYSISRSKPQCRRLPDGNILLCEVEYEASAPREVYVGVFAAEDGKVKVIFCGQPPDAAAQRLESCEINTQCNRFRVEVRPQPGIEHLSYVDIDCRRDFSSYAGMKRLAPQFITPGISPRQAQQIAAAKLRMPAHNLSVYWSDGVYTVSPVMDEMTLGGGPTVEVDANNGEILKLYFTE